MVIKYKNDQNELFVVSKRNAKKIREYKKDKHFWKEKEPPDQEKPKPTDVFLS
jgi:hypothetical protein